MQRRDLELGKSLENSRWRGRNATYAEIEASRARASGIHETSPFRGSSAVRTQLRRTRSSPGMTVTARRADPST
jgi:hypothetical protein